MDKVVQPSSFSGWNISLTQLWGYSPRFAVVCGQCHKHFRKRFRIKELPIIRCPHCDTLNDLPVATKK